MTTLPSRFAIHKMVSHGRSASRNVSFCSLFDPRFRFAPPRTAGAQLRAPYTGRAFFVRATHGFSPFRVEKLREAVMRGYLRRAAGVVSPCCTSSDSLAILRSFLFPCHPEER